MEAKIRKGYRRVLALILATLVPGSTYVQAEDSFIEQVSSDFAEQEMIYKPYARWWLAEGAHTDETLRESIQELYDEGFGGIEFVTLNESRFLDNADYAWGSAEWIHDTKVIIEECAKRGMSVSMTSGTHWATANLMSIHPDEEAASQELGYTTIHVSAKGDGTPASYKGYLRACDLPNNVKNRHL